MSCYSRPLRLLLHFVTGAAVCLCSRRHDDDRSRWRVFDNAPQSTDSEHHGGAYQ